MKDLNKKARSFVRGEMKERKRRDLHKEASFTSTSKGGKGASGFFVLFAICFCVLVLTVGLSNLRLYEGDNSNPNG